MDLSKRKTRYVVLPGSGIAGDGMMSSVFQDGKASALVKAFRDGLKYADWIPLLGEEAAPASASSQIGTLIKDDDFEVLSQRFDDGPALVSMTSAARLALEAALPNIRVLPLTKYYLPGCRPKIGQPAGTIAAENAIQDDGTVFNGDAKQWALARLPLAPADQLGAGVRIGIVDTGVDGQHPALAGRVPTMRCYVPGELPASGGPVVWAARYASSAGHGTHVAGIIAAQPGHGGPQGVAPSAELASYRVYASNPDGASYASNQAIIDSIRSAIEDGCQIINLSLEGAGLKEDGVRSAISDAWNQGVVCIAAAGNGYGNPVSYPAALAHCLAVTAFGRDGSFPQTPDFLNHVSAQRSAIDPAIFLASFSNFGPQVQFTAPGHAVVSTFPGGQWWFSSGTSMAAPFVAGMLARYLSNNLNVLNMLGNAQKSAAMVQMLIGRAHVLNMPQRSQEGYGLPA